MLFSKLTHYLKIHKTTVLQNTFMLIQIAYYEIKLLKQFRCYSVFIRNKQNNSFVLTLDGKD